jgi:2-aminomuconate deaminase
MEVETLFSDRAPEPVGPYPHVKRFGNLLFLCGIGPRLKGQKEIPGVRSVVDGKPVDYDIEPQCHAVFQNLRYILEDAGSRWENILDVTVFLINMKRDFPTFNRIYESYFREVQPTRTTVEVNALPTPIAIELKVIAYRD